MSVEIVHETRPSIGWPFGRIVVPGFAITITDCATLYKVEIFETVTEWCYVKHCFGAPDYASARSRALAWVSEQAVPV